MSTQLPNTGPEPESPVSRVSELLTDIIPVEILPKLPAKSLMRFKCVSKSFKTLISSSEFIIRHFLTTNIRLLILPANHHNLYSFELDSLDPIDPLDPVESNPISPVSNPTLCFPEGSISIFGSCNGLILINRDPHVIVNPSTRSYLDIPCFYDNVSTPSRRNVGFGYDESENDYKIVVVSDYDAGPENPDKTRVTSLYSVNSKSWKIVEQTLPKDSIEDRLSGVLIKNRLLHWRFWDLEKQNRRIGCFDVCTETWKDDVLLPEYYYDSTHMNYFLDFGVLDDQMSCSFENRIESTYDLWVMKEYGVQESWIKIVSIPATRELNGGIIPIASRGVEWKEVLIMQRFNAKMFWYNREDNTSRDVDLPDTMGLQPYVCKGSLVGLPGAKVFGAVYGE